MSVITVKEGGREGRKEGRKEGGGKGKTKEGATNRIVLKGLREQIDSEFEKRGGGGGHDQMRKDNRGREGGMERGEREKEGEGAEMKEEREGPGHASCCRGFAVTQTLCVPTHRSKSSYRQHCAC